MNPAIGVLLLIHGVRQSSARWAEMGYLEAFADEYPVVAVDLLGHGESDKLQDPASYTTNAQLDDSLPTSGTSKDTDTPLKRRRARGASCNMP